MVLAHYLDANKHLTKDAKYDLETARNIPFSFFGHSYPHFLSRSVLELGAAAALPSFVASLTAKKVIITDYPDEPIVNAIKTNAEFNLPKLVENGTICTQVSCRSYKKMREL